MKQQSEANVLAVILRHQIENTAKAVRDAISLAERRLVELDDERERLSRHISELKAALVHGS